MYNYIIVSHFTKEIEVKQKALLIAAVLTVSFMFAGQPTPKNPQLKVHAEQHDFSDGISGVWVFIQVDPKSYGDALPEKMWVDLEFYNELQKHWEVTQAEWFEGEPVKGKPKDGKYKETPPFLPTYHESDNPLLPIRLREVDETTLYTIRLRLDKRDDMEPESCVDAINNGKVLVVTARRRHL